MTIDWRADDRQFHLHNERDQLRPARPRERHARPPPLRARRWPPVGRTATSVRTRSRLLEPGGRAGPARVPDDRDRRLPGPGAGRRRGRRLDVARPALSRPPDPRRQAGPRAGLPATYVEADGEAETLEVDLADEPSGLERRAALHDLPRSAGHRPQRHASATTARGRIGLTCAMSARRRPARCRLGVRPAEPARGPASATSSSARLAPGRQSVAQHARRVEPPCTTRSSRCAARPRPRRHGEAYGFSLVYSGNFLAEAEVEPYGTTRVRLGISPDTFSWRSSRARRSRPPRPSWSTRTPGSAR